MIVDGDRAVLDRLERYLLMQATPKIFTATSPLIALRTLQDPKADVQCVICANKAGKISGLEFLRNLPIGRWGGPTLRDVKFMLMMASKDETAIQIADSFRVNGYLIGEFDRDSFITSVTKALTQAGADSPFKRYPVAHVRMGGADIIMAPLDKSFADKPQQEKDAAIADLQSAAEAARIGGGVVPVWETTDGRVNYIAPPNLRSALSAISMEFVQQNLNRELSLARELPAAAIEMVAASESIDFGGSDFGGPGIAKAPSAGGRTAPSAVAEKLTSGPDLAGGKDTTEPTGHRLMTHEDVGKVILACKQLGAEKFFKGFVRSQQIIHREAGKPTKVVLREFYVSFDQLRKALFADVNMRKLGQMYRDLTLALDQSIMRSSACFADQKEPFSVNLNVQSTLSKNFEVFLARMPLDLMTIEFRQSNIVEYFDEFLIIRGLLEAKVTCH